MKAKIIYRDASVKRGPSQSFGVVGTLPIGTIVDYSEIVKQEAGVKEWLKLSGGQFHGKYIASLFPDSNGRPISRVEFDGEPPPPPPPPAEPKINYAIVNYTDETGTHEETLYPK